MEKFTRGDRGSFRNGGGKGGFKGGFKGGWKGRDERGGESRPVVLHPATCSSCSKPCEVPFRPTGEKPVYCRDCFAGRAALGGERSQRKDYRGESTFTPAKNTVIPQKSFVNDDLKKQIDSMNIKLDKLTNTIQNLAERVNMIVGEKKVVEETVTPGNIEEKMVAKKVKKVVSKK